MNTFKIPTKLYDINLMASSADRNLRSALVSLSAGDCQRFSVRFAFKKDKEKTRPLERNKEESKALTRNYNSCTRIPWFE